MLTNGIKLTKALVFNNKIGETHSTPRVPTPLRIAMYYTEISKNNYGVDFRFARLTSGLINQTD